jgi:hypothetical protein
MDAVSPFVTVVSGLPRSGTSLMMQMLAAGGIPALTDGIRTPDEDNPRGYYEFEAVKQTKADPSWLQNAPGKVVKMVHLLLRDLPPGYDYRVIMMRRRIEEVLKSQKVMLERKGKPANASLSDEKLAQIFLTQMNDIGTWVRQQPNFRMIEVWHHELLADPEGQARIVSDFCGGLNTAAMSAAVDRSLHRNRAAK